MIIKILGSGCKKCKKLEENARQAISQLTGDHSIEKVTDLNQFMNYGVMITPALVIDEKVKSVGKVLSSEDIKKLIENK
ncbi:MAG: TM0996/MTH895 family glutaredoxin-like protein [Candidatus Cloacimonetes bacterium]|nr:TM0996/MTH895 family glutaredoxin-like protein [Candidatus Cloacimonadota bacterium]